jgi:hypothetical protein
MILSGDGGLASNYPLAAKVLLRPNSREVHRGIVSVPSKGRYGHGWYHTMDEAGPSTVEELSSKTGLNPNISTSGSAQTLRLAM